MGLHAPCHASAQPWGRRKKERQKERQKERMGFLWEFCLLCTRNTGSHMSLHVKAFSGKLQKLPPTQFWAFYDLSMKKKSFSSIPDIKRYFFSIRVKHKFNTAADRAPVKAEMYSVASRSVSINHLHAHCMGKSDKGTDALWFPWTPHDIWCGRNYEIWKRGPLKLLINLCLLTKVEARDDAFRPGASRRFTAHIMTNCSQNNR